MKEIELTQGKVALVDDGDFEWLNQWKWKARKSLKTFYAERSEGRRTVQMHRMILGLPLHDPRRTDHRNRDGLDNQRANLRVCTQAQNACNRSKYATTSKNRSQFTGVFHRTGHHWEAYIIHNGKNRYLGEYETEEIAARVRDAAAKELHGEFARSNLNFPEDILSELQKLRIRQKKAGTMEGAYWHKTQKKWSARYDKKDVYAHIGTFKTEIEAHEAYKKFLLNLPSQDSFPGEKAEIA